MGLTGFDAPCLHTRYFDKPMKGHSLVQAIAKVKRVFKNKPGSLIVDNIGIADDLRAQRDRERENDMEGRTGTDGGRVGLGIKN